MKKLLNATLAAVLSFTLIGCSNKSTTSQKESTTSTTENTAETKAEETKISCKQSQHTTVMVQKLHRHLNMLLNT